MARLTPNNASGKWLAMSDEDMAREKAKMDRAGDLLAQRQAAADEAARLSKTSDAAMRAYLRMRTDPSAKTDAQRAANVAAYIRRWSA